MKPILTLLFLCILAKKKKPKKVDDNWKEEVDEKTGQTRRSLQMETPPITEKEQYSQILPEEHHCRGCIAVIHNFNKSLNAKAHSMMKSWEYMDVFDTVCDEKMDGYGISTVRGANTLTGPGIEKDDPTSASGSVQMGGDRWRMYMSSFCRKILETVGEAEMYKLYLGEKMTKDLCDGEELTYCSETNRKAVPKKKEEEVEEEVKPKKKKDAIKKETITQYLRNLEIRNGVNETTYSKPRPAEKWDKVFKKLMCEDEPRDEL